MRKGYVVHPKWEARNMPVAEGSMTALCQVHSPDVDGEYDEATNRTPKVPGSLKFAGKCRVQRVNRELVSPNAGQQVTTSDYLVAVPFDANGIDVDDLVTVTMCTDPDLEGHRLTVTGVMKGSLRWERDLMCSDDQG